MSTSSARRGRAGRPPRAPRRLSRVTAGPYQLTASQSVAWHSTDADERDGMRAQIREACRRRLEADPHAQAVEVRDLGGRVLERVERPR